MVGSVCLSLALSLSVSLSVSIALPSIFYYYFFFFSYISAFTASRIRSLISRAIVSLKQGASASYYYYHPLPLRILLVLFFLLSPLLFYFFFSVLLLILLFLRRVCKPPSQAVVYVLRARVSTPGGGGVEIGRQPSERPSSLRAADRVQPLKVHPPHPSSEGGEKKEFVVDRRRNAALHVTKKFFENVRNFSKFIPIREIISYILRYFPAFPRRGSGTVRPSEQGSRERGARDRHFPFHSSFSRARRATRRRTSRSPL